jgi:hypothetical protein
MARRGRKPGSRKTGGRKRGTPNRTTIEMGGTFAETAKQFDAEAIATLVEVMRDKKSSPNARILAADRLLDRAHGRAAAPAVEPHREPGFVPLAERLKWYARRDEIEAAEAKLVQILPPKKRALPPATDQAPAGGAGVCLQSVRPVELPSGAMPRATTAEDDPFGPSWT